MDEAAKVMGGRARLQQVLDGKSFEAVINANKDPLYHLQRAEDILSTKMATAFDTAKAGGKHKNFLRDYEKLPDNLIEKAVRSIGKQIALHEIWIADPVAKLGLDHGYPPERVREYQVKWAKDINRQSEQMGILQGILEARRGQQR